MDNGEKKHPEKLYRRGAHASFELIAICFRPTKAADGVVRGSALGYWLADRSPLPHSADRSAESEASSHGQEDALLVHRLPIAISASRRAPPCSGRKSRLRKWAIAIYLWPDLAQVAFRRMKPETRSSVYRSQKSAWFMGFIALARSLGRRQRRSASLGPVEFDETYFGGKRKATCRMPSARSLRELAGAR